MDNQIYQTVFDQMVTSENTQMLKAFIPYLPPHSQQVMSIYTKATELLNTFQLFNSNNNMEVCSASVPDTTIPDLLHNIRKYCYGEKLQQLDQLNNLFLMLELSSLFNQQ